MMTPVALYNWAYNHIQNLRVNAENVVDHLKDKNNINNYNNTATLLQKHDPWQNNRKQTTHNANKSS